MTLVEATAFPMQGIYQAGILGLSWIDPSKDEQFRAWGCHLQAKCREEIQQTVVQPKSGAILEYTNYSEHRISRNLCLNATEFLLMLRQPAT